jgi:hypothetical protein
VSRIARAGAAALLAALVICATALADADPASDVLLAANAFYPYSPAVSSSLQATLNGELIAAHRARFPIKVAEIATPMDLGAIPALYDKPQQYAAFLDQEISFGSRVPLLVVMPDGYGGAGLSAGAAAALGTLSKPPAPTGNALTQAAISAVRKLADASGHPLGHTGAATSSSTNSGSVAVPLAILVVVCAGLAGGILAFRRRQAKTVLRARR